MPAMSSHHDSVRAVQWSDGTLHLIDQRKLPGETTLLPCSCVADVVTAIRDMVVRGAPAIGITAAYGVVIAARERYQASPQAWREALREDLDALGQARPTAVNLAWALARMQRCIDNVAGDPVAALLEEARRIHEEDIAANHRMGELGASLIAPDTGVLTHCNTGSLATGGFGTALGVIRAAYAAGKLRAVFADETRPWLQGARLTAWELVQDNIPVTLLADAAAAHLLRSGQIQWVIVGSDRIAANGDVANKIGTYGLAVLARQHGVRFMVVAPTSTVDLAIAGGDQIPIEERSPEEVLNVYGQRMAATGANAWNPAFDVTPHTLIDAIVTERGVVEQPDRSKMLAMMGTG